VERLRLLNGTDWYVWDADPAHKVNYTFHGSIDATGLAPALLATSEGSIYQTKVGAGGTLAGINALHGGLTTTCAAALNDYITIQTGSQVGVVCPYATGQDLYGYIRFRLPAAGDLTNHYVGIGFYLGVNDAVQIVYDSTVDGNWRFANTGGGGTTATVIAAADNSWHTVYFILTTTSCKCIYDYGAAITHTNNITANAMSMRAHNANQAVAGGKALDIQEFRILQNSV
jgi:hypothetical protein